MFLKLRIFYSLLRVNKLWTEYIGEQILLWTNTTLHRKMSMNVNYFGTISKREHKILVNRNKFGTILKSEQKKSVNINNFGTILKSE